MIASSKNLLVFCLLIIGVIAADSMSSEGILPGAIYCALGVGTKVDVPERTVPGSYSTECQTARCATSWVTYPARSICLHKTIWVGLKDKFHSVTASVTPPEAPPPHFDNSALGQYLQEVARRIASATPNPHTKTGGTAIIKFVIGIDGHISSKTLVQSSGTQALDDAASTALDGLSFPAIPSEVSERPLTLTQPFKFTP